MRPYPRGGLAALIVSCPRCGGRHTRRFFKALRQPIADSAGDFTRWGTCSKTGEPILLRGAGLKLDSAGLAHPTDSEVR